MYLSENIHSSNDIAALSCCFLSPEEIVRDYNLSLDEKRRLLASWASDARSIKDHPTYRLIDSGQVVPLAEILKAIAALDQEERNSLVRGCRSDEQQEKREKPKDSKDDDDPDDDPPPVPAGIFIPPFPKPPLMPELAV